MGAKITFEGLRDWTRVFRDEREARRHAAEQTNRIGSPDVYKVVYVDKFGWKVVVDPRVKQ